MSKVAFRQAEVEMGPGWQKMAYSITEACAALSLGRSTLYKLIAKGEIRAKNAGGKTLILKSEIDRWLEDLPSAAA